MSGQALKHLENFALAKQHGDGPSAATLVSGVVGEQRAERMLDRERDLGAIHSINQRIFETSLDLILVVDRRGTFIRVSPSSAAILGYQPEELVGRSAADFLHPDDLESTRTEMRSARRGRLERDFESRYVHKQGRAVTMAWRGVWSEPDQQYFFIGRDMTERNRADEHLRET